MMTKYSTFSSFFCFFFAETKNSTREWIKGITNYGFKYTF